MAKAPLGGGSRLPDDQLEWSDYGRTGPNLTLLIISVSFLVAAGACLFGLGWGAVRFAQWAGY